MLNPLCAGDFFTGEIPTADLYVLARIIHDWPEEKCLTLLKKIYDMCAPGQYRYQVHVGVCCFSDKPLNVASIFVCLHENASG